MRIDPKKSSVIGFTGTQHGVTDRQYGSLRRQLLRNESPFEFHHGDCIGADEEAHNLCVALRRSRELSMHIISHPPDNPVKRAFCLADEILKPLPYLERNKAIVIASRMLFACPAQRWEVMRSGTWATIRLARRFGRKIAIIFPDGTIERAGDWS